MKKSQRPALSVYLLTFNNSHTVERALKSVYGWADEIVVVDSLSTDETPNIVQKYANKWIQRPWPGFQAQYQFASEQCSNKWKIFIDADEEFPQRLRDEIDDFLIQQGNNPQSETLRACRIPRRTFYLGRWIRHGAWIPDREIRLFYDQCGSWSHGLHSAIETTCPVTTLKSVIYHYTYRDIHAQIQTINKYTETDSEIQFADGKKPSMRKMLLNPLWRILAGYVFKGGFLDGIPGLVVAISTGYYVFIKYAKLWEKHRVKSEFPNRGFYDEEMN